MTSVLVLPTTVLVHWGSKLQCKEVTVPGRHLDELHIEQKETVRQQFMEKGSEAALSVLLTSIILKIDYLSYNDNIMALTALKVNSQIVSKFPRVFPLFRFMRKGSQN